MWTCSGGGSWWVVVGWCVVGGDRFFCAWRSRRSRRFLGGNSRELGRRGRGLTHVSKWWLTSSSSGSSSRSGSSSSTSSSSSAVEQSRYVGRKTTNSRRRRSEKTETRRWTKLLCGRYIAHFFGIAFNSLTMAVVGCKWFFWQITRRRSGALRAKAETTSRRRWITLSTDRLVVVGSDGIVVVVVVAVVVVVVMEK